MKRTGRTFTTWILVAIMTCSTLAAGCEPGNFFRGNFSASILVPLGLGGTPGLLNPFGIVQAMVNALLGLGSSAGDTTGDGGETPSAAGAPPTFLDPSIGVVLD